MNYLRRFNENYESDDIAKICMEFGIENWSIRDGLVDVDGDVFICNKNLNRLPLNFGFINGLFDCSKNNLVTLEGAPIEVNGFFDCDDNQLTTLEGCPKKIKYSLFCSKNNLISLEGFPMSLSGSLNCGNNPIFEIWNLFRDKNQIEFFNDLDIVRDLVDGKPTFILDRLNFFLETIGEEPVTGVSGWVYID